MFRHFIKFLFMVLCVFSSYNKLLNINTTKKYILKSVVFSILISVITCLFRLKFSGIYIVIMVLLSLLVITYKNPLPFNTIFATTTISFGLSYFCFNVAVFATLPFTIVFSILIENEQTRLSLLMPIVCIVQFFITTIPFRFRRFKKGMPFLVKKNSAIIGVFASILIILFTGYFSIQKKDVLIFSISLTIATLFSLILFKWWKKQITKSYIEKLKANEIMELQNKIDMLKSENENLSKIIHKDNKLIPAMEMSVRELLTSIESQDSSKDYSYEAKQLLETLNTLSQERAGILSTYEIQSKSINKTGIYRLDALIQYMNQKAISNKINFDFVSNSSIKYLTQYLINEDALCTILADLSENAIIATKEQNSKNILLSIDIENECYCINFYDSGLPFDNSIISNLGKTRSTTHASTGGSGIGLMNTFETIKKCSASFVINEKLNSTTFTKKVSICFDNLSQYRLITQRQDITNISLNRNDIIIE